MKHDIELKEGGLCRISCMYEANEVQNVWKNVAARFTSSIRLPGFRPGKAPLAVLEKQFGQQMMEMATNTLVSRAVDVALAESGIVPVTGCRYEGGDAVRGQAFSFHAEFGVMTDIELPDIESLRFDEGEAAADPVHEELYLRELLGKVAERTKVEEGMPQDGDIVDVEVTGRVGGEVLPGMNTGACRMRLMPRREGEKAPDLDPIVRGLAIGQTGTGTTPCPDNYPDPSMRGKEIELTVVLKGIEREELPELTDDVARKLGFRNTAAVHAHVHEKMLEMDMARRMAETRRRLLGSLEEWEGFEAPASLVEHYRLEAARRSRQYLQKKYGSPDEFKDALASMREEAMESARKKARGAALLLTWARREGLALGQREFEAVLANRGARQGMGSEEYRLSLARTGGVWELKAALLLEKALSSLLQKIRQSR